jgi:hypothetical protein
MDGEERGKRGEQQFAPMFYLGEGGGSDSA